VSGVRRLRALPALRAEGLSAGWGRRALLDGLAIQAGPGERVAVLGPNGAGKTTLFDALSGRLAIRSGRVLLGREDVTRLPLHRRALLGLGYVPQEPSAFVDLSVRDNLRAAAAAPAVRGPRPDGAAIEAALRRWGLDGLADRRAAALSGGERRRLEVARALLPGPSVLLLDEPFAGLDPRGRQALRAGLEALPAAVALLVTDHSASDVLALCDRVVLLVDGQVAFDGPVRDFRPGESGWRRYFGDEGA
jgi:lipopolysaccharide export system ATP-binding protein